jgi:hypothetical protein
LYLSVGCDFSGVDSCYGSIYRPQFFTGRNIFVALYFVFELVRWVYRHDAKIARENPLSNHYGAAQPRFPNASTCSPSRRRTIQNSSTVSKASAIEVAAAAPWPPKRGTSAMQSATFITKESA